MQSSALHQGAPDKRPVDQINWLRDQQLITPQMAELAHHIRSLGGDGAHPPKNVLDEVDDEDSRRSLEFLDHFLTYVYKIPASLQRLEPEATLRGEPSAAAGVHAEPPAGPARAVRPLPVVVFLVHEVVEPVFPCRLRHRTVIEVDR